MPKLSYLLLFSIILNFSFSVDYIEEIQPMFNASCTSCHNSASPSYDDHQLDLSSYLGLMLGGESGSVVIPFDANSSILWQKINIGEMPPYGSGSDLLTTEQINLIADWINEGALEEVEGSANWDCQSDSDCMDDEFCAVECFTGGCGLDDSELVGMVGQYCQPCDECDYPQDAVSGNCDACGGASDDGGDDGGGDGAPECMMDCEGIDTVDPDEDANAFCEWFMPTYDDTTCLDDCDYDYDLMIEQIYSMCQLCLVDNSCDDMWNSEDCSDLDESDCEDNADCNWNDYYMMCEEAFDDGPPQCWLDCEGSEVLSEDMTGTELCTWFVPVYEDGSCLGDCDSDELFMNSMINSMCSECLQDDSCDDMFDDNSCSDLDQSECEENEGCSWNEYDMMCEDASGDDGGGDGPPDCTMDCGGIEDVDPDEDATSFCSWYIPIYDDGTCLEDCEGDDASDLDAIYSMCQVCIVYGNCDDMWDALEICTDLDQSECEENADCEWDDYDMVCEDTGDLDNELIVQGEYRISSVYPNPFNPTTTITYEVPHFASVSIDVYNMNGQLVKSLYKGFKNPGEYSINWDASNATSGAYLIKLVSGSFVETQKVMLVK